MITITIDNERLPDVTEKSLRWRLLRRWDWRVIGGSRKVIRARILELQQHTCPLCREKLTDDIHLDHLRTVREFANDLTLDITDAILQCWSVENLRAVHNACNQKRNSKAAVRVCGQDFSVYRFIAEHSPARAQFAFPPDNQDIVLSAADAAAIVTILNGLSK